MSMDSHVKRGHPITFGLLIFFAIIELALAAWLTSRFNAHHNYLNISERDRVRFILFCSTWTIAFSTFYLVLFLHSPGGSVLTSIASHLIFLFFTWIMWTAGAAAVTQMLGGGLNCKILVTFITVVILIRAISAARRGDGYRGPSSTPKFHGRFHDYSRLLLNHHPWLFLTRFDKPRIRVDRLIQVKSHEFVFNIPPRISAPLDMSLQTNHGVVALAGALVNQLAQTAWEANPQILASALPTRKAYHITLISKAELKELGGVNTEKLKVDTDSVFSAGVGSKSKTGVYFVVIVWAAGQQLRKQFGLPPKHFHITLSNHDDHTMDKGIDSLLPGQFPANPTPDFLDHLAFTLHLWRQYHNAISFSTNLAAILPDSPRGFLRLGDSALLGGQTKLAMLAFACAFERSQDEKLESYSVKKLIQASKGTEWGPLLLPEDVQQIPAELSSILLTPWSERLRCLLKDANITPTLHLESRHRFQVPIPGSRFYELPRFFRWLIPYHIAIMSTPRCEEDIDALASPHLGIRHVLTLTEEEPLPSAWFRHKTIRNTFLPIANFHPPSIEQMDVVLNLISDGNNLPMLIHCGGGKGRAGTVAACYLAAFGFKLPQYTQCQPELPAAEAIALLRNIRPGSLETPQQEAFVSKWCSTIWKRQSVYPDLPSEPPPCSLEVEGEQGDKHDLFILVGLPGSGKSWFSKALLSRDPAGWTHISQDDTGSRSACETEIGRAKGRVLLDRCNTPVSDRKSWLQLASNWASTPACIWFDYDRDLCSSRAQMRAGHPTLPPGSRVRNAVQQMHKDFVRPTLKEGFKAIFIIRSFAAAEELVRRLSPPITIFKFPRTSHLINLGAATSDDVVNTTDLSSISGQVNITEKIDGANMGFSLSSDRAKIIVQNRSHYVDSSSHEQFKKLGLWVERHEEELRALLGRDPHFPERYILFGEWMFATHSIPYSRLPDHFIAFDFYDRTTQSWADRGTLQRLLAPTTIHLVPVLYEGPLPSEHDLRSMVQRKSVFWDGRVEGIYVKVEKNERVVSRSKIVRGDFITGNEHWTRGGVRPNGLADSG
ncbi:hypothetical protein BD779DRAFT_1465255 [Infundibulicybe gibba]|nr:hypothetical protein BD779DRAFT_1465255 [Infundibulicybe gibba]